MTLIAIGFLIGIYLFARKVVKNEPLKGQIDSIIDTTNKTLSFYKDKKPRQLFDSLLKLSNKGILYSFILCFFILLLPDKLKSYLLMLIAPILILCAILSLSISWISKHNKTFKELFLNFQMIVILFSPIIFHFLDLYLKKDGLFSSVFYPFHYAIENFGLIYFQIFWIVGVVSTSYLGMMLIALPTYFTIYSLIFISAYIIRIVEKHIDGHIIDGIVGLIGVILLFLKLFT